MDTVMQRRTFLKGLMAAAAIPVVAPLVPMMPVVQAVESEPGLLMVEYADVWVKRNFIWDFVGRTSAINMSREVSEIDVTSISDGPNMRFMRGLVEPPRMEMNLISDAPGYHLLLDSLGSRERLGVAIGFRDLFIVSEKSFLTGIEETTFGDMKMARQNVTFQMAEDGRFEALDGRRIVA